MTGGRLTRNTNDYTVGYARARRDLGCRYTVGFYDHHPEADKRHEVRVEARRKGVHLIYAARFSFPSKKARRSLALEAAFLVPQQFEGGGLRAHLFSLQPLDAKRWSAILAVDFPFDVPNKNQTSTREFGAVLRRGPDVVHTFNRSISLHRNGDDASGVPPRVTFVEPVTLPPGRYALTAVLSDPEAETPFGRVTDLTVPPIAKHDAILAGPVLGRRRGNDVVVYGGGDAKGPAGDRVGARAAFRPLLINEVDRAEPLAALTHVCFVRPKGRGGPWSVSRRLETSAGAAAGSLSDVSFSPHKGGPVQCERLLDQLPVMNLKTGGYTFRAVVGPTGLQGDQSIEAQAPFALEDSEARASGADDSP